MQQVANDLSKGSNCPLILINLSDLTEPKVIEHLWRLNQLLKHSNLKDQIVDEGFEQHFSAVVTENIQIHSICRGIIATTNQYTRQLQTSETSIFDHLQSRMSKLHRGLKLNTDSDRTQILQQFELIEKSQESTSKKNVKLSFFQQEFKIDIENYESDSMINKGVLKLAEMASLSQSVKMLPFLNINFEIVHIPQEILSKMQKPDYKKYQTQLIDDLKSKAKKILSNLVFELQNLDVQLEQVVICTNFAETLCLAMELLYVVPEDCKFSVLKNFATGIAFYTSRLYYTTLPPAIPAIYNSISFSGSRSKISYLILNQMEVEMKTLSCWGSGILIQGPYFEQAAKQYSVKRRIPVAQIKFVNQLETLGLVLKGWYKEENK